MTTEYDPCFWVTHIFCLLSPWITWTSCIMSRGNLVFVQYLGINTWDLKPFTMFILSIKIPASSCWTRGTFPMTFLVHLMFNSTSWGNWNLSRSLFIVYVQTKVTASPVTPDKNQNKPEQKLQHTALVRQGKWSFWLNALIPRIGHNYNESNVA